MIKGDFHMHTSQDPMDYWFVKHSPQQLIDRAVEKGIGVIAITHHDHILEDPEVFKYAKKRGVLLIKGCEATIEGKHILVLNPSKVPHTFEELREMREKENILVIAPHAFFPMKECLNGKLIEHIDLFDAIEVSYLFPRFFNLNFIAKYFARKYGKTIVANSDTHHIENFGYNYSKINASKNMNSIFKAIKANNLKLNESQIPTKNLLKMIITDLGKPKPKKGTNRDIFINKT